jgi:hypothetical protein
MIKEIQESNIKINAPSQKIFNDFRQNDIKIQVKLILN